MSHRLSRTQILLEPEQHQTLKQVAESENISYSELVRIIVAEFLLHRDKITKQRKQLEVIKKARTLQAAILAAHGVAKSPSIAEIIALEREERDAQIYGRSD